MENVIAQVGAAQRDLYKVSKRVDALEAKLEALTHQGIVDRLVKLRKDLEADGALYEETPAILLLADVAQALGLDEAAVLGEEAALDIELWSQARMWLPVVKPNATATHPLPELAAVAVA